jgi:hypothetical protein
MPSADINTIKEHKKNPENTYVNYVNSILDVSGRFDFQ